MTVVVQRSHRAEAPVPHLFCLLLCCLLLDQTLALLVSGSGRSPNGAPIAAGNASARLASSRNETVAANARHSGFGGPVGAGGQLSDRVLVAARRASRSGLPPPPKSRGVKPRVYFLFLAISEVYHLDVWNAFFAAAPASETRVFLHCKQPDACRRQVAGTVFEVVASVPTKYCTDLVGAQEQLLSSALTGDFWGGSALDKFVFVSDSTLPAKPFSEIYGTLSQRTGSDICTMPVNDWKPISNPRGFVAVKHHQWVVLNRAHAERTVDLWSKAEGHDLHVQNACLDEVWYMWALYGLQIMADRVRTRDVRLGDTFTGDTLRTSPASIGMQGQCDTFALWHYDWSSSANHDMFKLYDNLDEQSQPEFDKPRQHPGEFFHMSLTGMRRVRQSPFLFIRKVAASAEVRGTHEEVQKGFSAEWIANVLT